MSGSNGSNGADARSEARPEGRLEKGGDGLDLASRLAAVEQAAQRSESGRGEAGLFLWFLRLLRPERGVLLAAMGCLVVATFTALAQPYLVKAAIDGPIAAGRPADLWPLAALYLAAVLVHGVASYGQQLTSVLAGQRVVDTMRRRLFSQAVSFRPAYYDRTPVGAVLTRITNDTEALHEAISSGVVTSIASLTVLVGSVVGMFLVAGWWALPALIALPPLLVGLNLIRKALKEGFERIRALGREINEFLEERFSGMAVVQAFAAERRMLDHFDERNEEKLAVEITSTSWQSVLSAVIQLASLLSVAVILWAAGFAAGGADGARGGITLGALVALVDYLQRFYGPLEDLSGKYAIFQRAFVSLDKIAGFLDRKEYIEATDDPVPVAPLHDEILFDDVRFEYRDGKEVLHGVTLRVKRGESVALVGATGAGKTTLARLLGRFYDVSSGSVTWDGLDVRRADPDELRRQMAFVPQDVFLFSRSLADNITLDDDSPDPERIRAALRGAHAEGVIESLPEGIETVVGERGQDLSAGERQLLALARALYRDPSVLVLDEATSHVDLQTEARIREAMRDAARGRTTLLIAHRLATAREADRIAVVLGGRITEEGTHEELMKTGGHYARLWQAADEAVLGATGYATG